MELSNIKKEVVSRRCDCQVTKYIMLIENPGFV
jgi:hypothetical protein